MRTRSLEYDLVLLQLIYKQPVCFNATFSATCIVSNTLMIAMERIKQQLASAQEEKRTFHHSHLFSDTFIGINENR